MLSMRDVMKWMTVLSLLSLLFAFSSGCSASKEAVAAPMKVTPVPAAAPAPAVDYAQD